MSSVTRALLVSSADRYVGLVINFTTIATLSRLLSPAEVGVAAIGMSIMMTSIAIREFATPHYLVQLPTLTLGHVRTSVTIYAAASGLAAAVLALAAPWLASKYGQPQLADFLDVLAVGLVVESIASPIFTLLQRRLDYTYLAVVNIAGALTNVIVAVSLAVLGYSSMSVAWAALASSTVMTALLVLFRPKEWSGVPSLSHWRSVLSFCGYQGLSSILVRTYESLPQQIIGKWFSAFNSGLFARTLMVSQLGDKLFLLTVSSLALPVLAKERRQGRELGGTVLHALTLITAVQWPLLVLVALLAHPIVLVLLGAQWVAIAPLVRMMTLAAVFAVPSCLCWAALLTLGHMRDRFLSLLIAMPVGCLIFFGAARWGMTAAVASFFVITPFQTWVQLHFMHWHIPLAWADYGRALWRSAAVAAAAAAGPLLVMAVTGSGPELSIVAGILGGCLGLMCWGAALWALRHPLFDAVHRTLAPHLVTALQRLRLFPVLALLGDRSTDARP